VIVLVSFPFTDMSGTKQRPALVLSHNRLNPDVLVGAITSQIPAQLASDEFEIPAADLRPCGLPKRSILRLTKLVSLHERLVIKQIGQMPEASFQSVLAQLRKIFS
jgi:mRNA interferase MazF